MMIRWRLNSDMSGLQPILKLISYDYLMHVINQIMAGNTDPEQLLPWKVNLGWCGSNDAHDIYTSTLSVGEY